MKVIVNGEAFDYDLAHVPMSDALAIEREWKRRYAEWEQEFYAGSAEAACVLIWLLWRKDGRDIPLADILGGEVDFDYSDVLRSIVSEALAMKAEAEAAKEDPTIGVSAAPDGTGMTPSNTSGRSPKSSGSGRGKSVA